MSTVLPHRERTALHHIALELLQDSYVEKQLEETPLGNPAKNWLHYDTDGRFLSYKVEHEGRFLELMTQLTYHFAYALDVKDLPIEEDYTGHIVAFDGGDGKERHLKFIYPIGMLGDRDFGKVEIQEVHWSFVINDWQYGAETLSTLKSDERYLLRNLHFIRKRMETYFGGSND